MAENKIAFSIDLKGQDELSKAFRKMQEEMRNLSGTTSQLSDKVKQDMENFTKAIKRLDDAKASVNQFKDSLAAVDRELSDKLLSPNKQQLVPGLKRIFGDLNTELDKTKTKITEIEDTLKRFGGAAGGAGVGGGGGGGGPRGPSGGGGGLGGFGDDDRIGRMILQSMIPGGIAGQILSTVTPGLAIGAAYTAGNVLFNPVLENQRQIAAMRSQYSPAEEAMAGNPIRQMMREWGVGTAERQQSGIAGLWDASVGTVARTGMGLITQIWGKASGESFQDYLTRKRREESEETDKLLFSQFGESRRFQRSIAPARHMEQRMFGIGASEATIRDFAQMGLSEESQRFGADMIARGQGRLPTAADALFMFAGRDYGISDPMRAMIARSYGDPNAGIKDVMGTLSAAGMGGTADRYGANVLQNYIAGQMQTYGTGTFSAADLGAGLANVTAFMGRRPGALIGPEELAQGAVNAMSLRERYNTPGSFGHTAQKAALVDLGIPASVADVFIDLGLEKSATQQKLIETAKAAGVDIDPNALKKRLSEGTTAQWKMTTGAISSRWETAGETAGLGSLKTRYATGARTLADVLGAQALLDPSAQEAGESRFWETKPITDSQRREFESSYQRNKENLQDQTDKSNAKIQAKQFDALARMPDALEELNTSAKGLSAQIEQQLEFLRKAQADRAAYQTKVNELKGMTPQAAREQAEIGAGLSKPVTGRGKR